MGDDEELLQAIRDLVEAQAEIDRLAERDGLRGPLEPSKPVPVASHDYRVAVERLMQRSERYQRIRNKA